MRVLFDTNIVLDVLLQRHQWYEDAESVCGANVEGRLEACITASSVTDVYYVTHRLVGVPDARRAVRHCLDTLTVLTTDEAVLELAYLLNVDDFEDAVQIVTAERERLDAIITRDTKGFAGSPVAVLTPMELVARLQSER